MHIRQIALAALILVTLGLAPAGASYAQEATTTPDVATTTPPAPETIHLGIRAGDTLIGPFTVDLPTSGATTSLAATGDATPHELSGRSLLAVLSALDASHDEFTVTDLQYNGGWGAFYLRCLALPAATSTPLCDNWTYSVNGTFPQVGADSYLLAGNDTAYLFFGPSHRVSLSTTTALVNEAFTATAETYDAATGTFGPLTGVTLGATQPDPSNPWGPFERALVPVDSNGQSIFTLAATGTYDIGIKEDFYYPTSPVTVIEPPVAEATSTPEAPATPSGGTSGSTPITHAFFDTPRALAYLASQQKPDGSFGSSMITDWVAIALASGDAGSMRDALRTYLLGTAPTLSSITDFERHTMALMALSIDPYTGTNVNTIAPIVAGFDGTQIGSTYVHDDIFAIFPLLRAGYGTGDEIISKTVAYIVHEQQADGSWGDPDTTGAALQALALAPGLPGVADATTRATNYLRAAQQVDGGWYNADSTSWVMTALTGLGVPKDAAAWTSTAGFYPSDSLATAQQADGGVRPVAESADMRTWSTSYALVAASGKSWSTLLQSFSKPSSGGSSGGGSAAASSTATTTIATMSSATTSPLIAPPATTTPQVLGAATSTAATSTSTTSIATTAKKQPRPTSVRTAKPMPQQAPKNTPIASTSQPASAATVAPQGLFGRLWHFFTGLFR